MVHGYEYGRNHRRCDVWWWRRPEGSWPMARIRSEQQAMSQVNVIDDRWVGGRQYSTAGGLVVWCCGRGEVDECGRHGWMRLPCCLLGEEAVGVLCRYRSTYSVWKNLRSWPRPGHLKFGVDLADLDLTISDLSQTWPDLDLAIWNLDLTWPWPGHISADLGLGLYSYNHL